MKLFKNRKKTIIFISLILVFTLMACSNDNATDKPETTEDNGERKSISIGLDPYDYATVPAYLSKVILEQEGFDVNIEEAQVGILYEALSNKDIDAFIDIWTPNLQGTFIEQYKDDFEFAGTLYTEAPIGIAVPSYMEEVNSIDDLQKYPDEFEGTIFAIDAGTGMTETTEVMLDEYKMNDFTMENSSTPAMLSYAKSRIQKEEGVAFHAWRPHPMFMDMDIKLLDDPKEVWKLDDIKIGVIPELKDESPTAQTLFSNMTLNIDEVEEWMIEMDQDDIDPLDLANEWVEENEDRVNEWLEK